MLIAAIVSVDPFGERLRPGTGAGFVVLAAFVLSFLAIRTSARLTRSVSWWPGGVESGGVHIHHLVWGICLMMFCGFLAFAAPLEAPWWHFVAIGFGVGAGLTMDEFALWVRLQDVYWAKRAARRSTRSSSPPRSPVSWYSGPSHLGSTIRRRFQARRWPWR